MQDIQIFLDYLSLLPVAIAFALLLFHLMNCWQDTATSSQNVGVIASDSNAMPGQFNPPDPARLAELQLEEVLAACQPELCNQEPSSILEMIDPCNVLGVRPEPCDQAEAKQGITIMNPSRLNSEQLRKECSKLGIRWRNAKGKGKHLTRLEMLNALGRAIA